MGKVGDLSVIHFNFKVGIPSEDATHTAGHAHGRGNFVLWGTHTDARPGIWVGRVGSAIFRFLNKLGLDNECDREIIK